MHEREQGNGEYYVISICDCTSAKLGITNSGVFGVLPFAHRDHHVFHVSNLKGAADSRKTRNSQSRMHFSPPNISAARVRIMEHHFLTAPPPSCPSRQSPTMISYPVKTMDGRDILGTWHSPASSKPRSRCTQLRPAQRNNEWP